MGSSKPFYVGNAELDMVRGSGWFIGQFVPTELGLPHQTDVELKWGIHPNGEKRSHPWATGDGTKISVLIQGAISVNFYLDEPPQVVTLRNAGDYIIFRPEVVHSREAIGHTVVISVRFPSVEVGIQVRIGE